MITTITLNPMLDKTVAVDRLELGTIHRASKIEMVPGGKGLNVSLQLKLWGVKTIATGFLGGEIGSIITRLLNEKNIDHDFIMTDALTREGVTYRESSGAWTSVFEPPLPIQERFIQDLAKKIDALTAQSTWIVCGGSSPVPEADNLYFDTISKAQKKGIPTVLDSYGNAFQLALKAMPTLVKPNKREFETTFKQSLHDEKDFLQAINHLLDGGIQYVIITDGANDCYGGFRGHTWRVTPPKMKGVNATGSGDVMIAGILYGFRQGWKFERALIFGAAAGAANAAKWEVAEVTLNEVAALEPQVVARRVST